MNRIYRVLGAGMFLIMSMHTQANIKQNIEKQGFVFVKQIPAPQGMTGWVGHEDQYSNTVFISNDDKYYIKGEHFNNYSKVTLNGKELETIFLGENVLGLLEAVDPKDAVNMKVSQIEKKTNEILSTTE